MVQQKAVASATPPLQALFLLCLAVQQVQQPSRRWWLQLRPRLALTHPSTLLVHTTTGANTLLQAAVLLPRLTPPLPSPSLPLVMVCGVRVVAEGVAGRV